MAKMPDTLRKENRLLFLAFHPARRFSSCQGQRSMLGRANARAIKRGILSASIDDNFRWPASSIRQRQSRRFPATEQDPIRFSIGDRSFFSFVAARKRVTEALRSRGVCPRARVSKLTTSAISTHPRSSNSQRRILSSKRKVFAHVGKTRCDARLSTEHVILVYANPSDMSKHLRLPSRG